MTVVALFFFLRPPGWIGIFVGAILPAALACPILYLFSYRPLAGEVKRVKDSEEKMRLVLDSTAEGIYGADLEGKCTICNATCASLLGYKHPDDLIGKNVHLMMHHSHPDGTPYPVEECRIFKAFRTGAGTHADNELFWRADGSGFPVEYWAHPQWRNGAISGVVATFVDITERRKLEEQYRQSQKMEVVGQLTSGVAHDFNNLLTIINGYSRVLIGQMPKDSPVRLDLEEISKAGDRATALVSKLLLFSRRDIAQPKVIDLNNLVMSMDKMLRRLIPVNIEFVTLPGTDLGTVKVSVANLEAVLTNLVVNAVHAMPAGGKIMIETRNVVVDPERAERSLNVTPGEYVVLTITDTGSGMSDEVKKHLFEPFFTTKGAGRGTGLGLATSYDFTKRHGGTIEIWSEVGRGTSLGIYLPRIHEKLSDWYDSENTADLPRGTETILVVEDEPTVRRFAVRLLTAQGYHALECSNGDEALRFLKKEGVGRIHLILTDVVMPQLGGKELAEKVKRLAPHIKVMFMSGYAEDPVLEKDRKSGTAKLFLSKPFTPRALAFKVREILDRPV